MTIAKAAVLLLVAGWPAARLVVPRGFALLLAPAVAALVATVAASASLVTRTPLWPWLVVVLVAPWIALARRRFRCGSNGSWAPVGFLPASVIAIVALDPLRATRLAPVLWDARSIWWLHAKFLWAGGDRAAEALGTSVFAVSHPDYPPLPAAAVAGAWTVAGDNDLWMAQAIMSLLTYAGVVAAGITISGLFGGSATHAHGRGRRRVLAAAGAAVGAGFCLASFSVAGERAVRGYADLLWSGWFVTAAIVLLLYPPERDAVRVGAVALAVAMLTKNEGMLAGAVLIVLACVRSRHDVRRMLPLAVPLSAAVFWVVLVRLLGAESEFTSSDGLGGLLRGDADVLARVRPAVTALRDEMGWIAAVGATVAGAGCVCLRDVRRSARIGSGLWTLTLTGAVVGLLVLAYVISPRPLEWHLSTSVHRTTIAPSVLLLADVAVWAAVAARTLVDPAPARRHAGDRRGPPDPTTEWAAT